MIIKSVLKGLLGMLLLLGSYFLVLSLVSGFGFFSEQFSKNWYWILGLSSGFGIQIGIFTYLRARHRDQVSAKAAAASGATSTVAMISCCAHYLVNILPIIGISGLIAVIGQYQIWLFWIGLVSNLLGIIYMAKKLVSFKLSEKAKI